jgi:branched-chain amino acid transport system ATP-binding protein
MLAVDGVCAGYGRMGVLSSVSLEVRAGEIVALVGTNGAGKSTLMAAIAGLIRPTAGRVVFDGSEITGLPTHAIARKGLVLVPEGRDLFPDLSVSENLAMGAFGRRKAAGLERDFEEIFGRFPVLRERSRQLASTLSGGEQQMLAIARALMARPRMLLLDEPSLGIAPKVTEAIFDILLEINRTKGVTTLLVEQNTTLALAVSSRAYVMATGKVVAEGPSADLARSDAIRQAYLSVEGPGAVL